MADYASQAASIYDPQLAAEKATLTAGYNSNVAGFTGEENSANTAYTQALRANTQNEAGQEDRNNFTAATHGLWQSGLIANMQRMTGRDYGQKAGDIETARAQKLADIASRRQAETMGYNAKLGALASKYQGSKSQYIAEHQNADAAAARQEAAANARAAYSASRRQPTAAELKASAYSNLQDDVAGMFNGFGARPTGYTEKVILPQLQNAYAQYGIKSGDIANYVYNYRKSKFGS